MADEDATHGTGEHPASVWPFVLAVAGGLGFGGLATRLFPLVVAGLVVLIVGIAGWVRQDIRGVSFAVRGRFEAKPFAGIGVRKLGMWVFIISEIFFFAALIGSGLTLRVMTPPCGPSPVAACWPNPAAEDFPLNIPVTAVNTFILIASSFTMAEAVHAAMLGKKNRLKGFLLLTLILGVTFVTIQVYEYNTLFFEEHLTPWPNDIKPWLGTFGTAFYTQTAFHGAHVTGGVLGLAYLTVRAWRGAYGKDNFETVEIVGLYWHFVDIVWIFLFPIMYLIGR